MPQHLASPGPYREASAPDPDDEVIALARLVEKAQRVRRLVALPILSAGVLLGAVAYIVSREIVFAGIDARAPYLVVLLTWLPAVVAAQAMAAFAGRRAVMRKSPAWIAEITPRGGSPMLLEMFVRSI
jgi:hypothetical protein